MPADSTNGTAPAVQSRIVPPQTDAGQTAPLGADLGQTGSLDASFPPPTSPLKRSG